MPVRNTDPSQFHYTPGPLAGTILPRAEYSFNQIPNSIGPILTGNDAAIAIPRQALPPLPGIKRVVLFLIDACGVATLESLLPELDSMHPAFTAARYSELLTSFPSTTTTMMTELHTGLRAAESGIYEWTQRLKLSGFDRLVQPLKYAEPEEPANSLLALFPDSRAVFPFRSLYERLAELGITSKCFIHADYGFSPFNAVVSRGSETLGYFSFDDGMRRLSDEVRKHSADLSYFCFYTDVLDIASHIHGAYSHPVRQRLRKIFESIAAVVDTISPLGETLILMTADHGHVEVDPMRTIYLNEEHPELSEWMEYDSRNQRMGPSGSPRDLFLHVKSERIDDAVELLQRAYGHRAFVTPSDQYAMRLFGDTGSALRERLGSVLVLPDDDNLFFWRSPQRAVKFFGHHGGLTAKELKIPLLAWRV